MTEIDDTLAEPARRVLDACSQPTLGAARRASLKRGLEQAIAAGTPAQYDVPPGNTAGTAATGAKLTAIAGAAAAVGIAAGLFVASADPEPPRVDEPAIVMEAPRPEPEPERLALEPQPPTVTPEPAEPPRRRARTPAKKAQAEPDTSSPETPSLDDVAAEARVLKAVQEALRAGQPREALRLAEEHERRFPSGALVEAREAARAIARCQLDPEAGKTIPSAFERRFPSSAYSRRVANACSPGVPGG